MLIVSENLALLGSERPCTGSSDRMQEFAPLASGLPWLPAPEKPSLGHNVIHVWRAAINMKKEAYIKARGKGMSIPLDQFDVSLIPGQPAVLLYTHGDLDDVSRWSLRDLDPSPGYAAALAAEGRGWHVNCLEWPDQ